MSTYTTELRYPLTQGENIGLTDYPIFDEAYREPLNQKIIQHFWFREIGFDTWGKFVYILNRRMNEIMPAYNKMYQYTLDDLLSTHRVKISEDNLYTGNEESVGKLVNSGNQTIKSDGSMSGKTNEKNHENDTPMGKISDIFNPQYASSAGVVDTTTSSSSTDNETHTDNSTSDNTTHNISNTTENKNLLRTGIEGSRTLGEILMENKDSFLNIDMAIINDLEPLFIGIW